MNSGHSGEAAEPLLGSREHLGEEGHFEDRGAGDSLHGGGGSGQRGWLSEQLRGGTGATAAAAVAETGQLLESPTDRNNNVLRLPAGYHQAPRGLPARMTSARHRDATRAR